MANLNKVMLIGNLTRDPDLKYTPGNQAVCEIGLAVNRKYRTKDNEEREEVTFIDCEAWGKAAEIIKQYMTKGRPIFIEGRLKLDTWEKDGKKNSKLRVVCYRMQLLGSRSGDAGRGPKSRVSAGRGAAQSGGDEFDQSSGYDDGPSGGPVADDDIPF